MNYLALDVGGTFIKHALMDEHGAIIKQGKVPTPLTTQAEFFQTIQNIIHVYDKPMEGIALSLPGTVQAESGFVFQGGNLKYNAMCNVKELLEEIVHIPVEIENDAHCAAIAELQEGNLKGIENGMVLTFGTGIGGCIVVGGRPYKGTHLFAGEVSILLTKDVYEHGLHSIWGPQGSFTKFVKRVCDEKKVAVVDGKTLFKWIEHGDTVACSMFHSYCDNLVQQLFNFQILLDPQRICVGGGVSANPFYIQSIQEAMDRLYKNLPFTLPSIEITECKFHNDANLLGAYYNFMNRQGIQ